MENWKEEWKWMPEYIQTKKSDCYCKLTIRFNSEEDLQKFAELIGQKITNKTKSIRFPEIERGLDANKIYVDKDEAN